jgi:citrate lyase beta subunit
MIDVINTVVEKQRAGRLTDTQMASKIGMNRVSWNRIKNRKTRFGKKFLTGVSKAYPDIFLLSKVTNSDMKLTFIQRILRIGRR